TGCLRWRRGGCSARDRRAPPRARKGRLGVGKPFLFVQRREARSERAVSLLSDLCAFRMGFRGPAAHSTAALVPALRHGTKGGVLCSPPGVAKGRWVVLPFRRLAELVGFGDRGMRDCATPNSLQSACATTRAVCGCAGTPLQA